MCNSFAKSFTQKGDGFESCQCAILFRVLINSKRTQTEMKMIFAVEGAMTAEDGLAMRLGALTCVFGVEGLF